MTKSNRFYKVIGPRNNDGKLVADPKAAITIKGAVGLTEQQFTDRGTKILWYVTIDRGL